MKPFMILLMSFIFTSSVFAEDGQWVLTNETSKKGVTPYGVKTILNDWEYSKIFDFERRLAVNQTLAGEEVTPIDTLEVITKDYKWEGNTQCSPGDPALTRKTYEYTVCYGNENFCGYSISIMPWGDPCDSSGGIIIGPTGQSKRKRTKVSR